MNNLVLKMTTSAIAAMLLAILPALHVSADEISQEASVIISNSSGFARIASPKGELIGSFYIEWDVAPKVRTITTDIPHTAKTPPEADGYGFVNDFVELETPASGVRITWDILEKGVSISRIRVFSPGEVPANIQKWEPQLEKADMLLISTHADDEHLYFGGAMPVYAGEKGKKVQVAYFVDHGIRRTRELLAGLWEVGIRNYPLISNFPDQYVDSYDAAVKFYGSEKPVEFQVMLLRRFKPDVVLGHDLDGEYGHGAHMLNARSLVMALELSSDENVYPESADLYGLWDVKKCYLHLYEENEVVMDWTVPLEYFGGRSGWEMAIAGYGHHISQHQFKFRVRIEGPNDCRRFGLYRSTVGPDIKKDDFFENIAAAEVTVQPTPTTAPTFTPFIPESSDPDESPEVNSLTLKGIIMFIITGAAAFTALVAVHMSGRKRKVRRRKRK